VVARLGSRGPMSIPIVEVLAIPLVLDRFHPDGTSTAGER
jgi:hypothetical protein